MTEMRWTVSTELVSDTVENGLRGSRGADAE